MIQNTNNIIETFFKFFLKKGHKILEGSSLIPNNDNTILFTNSGMNQFKNIFLGVEKSLYKNVVTLQKCLRAGGKHNDFNKIGHTNLHHTFFEMLGNFSFGGYFKDKAIEFAWELLTEKKFFNIPENKLLVTVYEKDVEAYNIWKKKICLPDNKIIRIGNKNNSQISDNFWQMGDVGPCGPCTEIFYDHGEHILGNIPGSVQKYGERYVEIWNLVFIQFNKNIDGSIHQLSNQYIDTGMGVERISAVLQNTSSNYRIDIFNKLIYYIKNIFNIKQSNNISLYIIADHIRACTFIIADNVLPSNEGRGYILRRIIRRAIIHGRKLGIYKYFLYNLVYFIIKVMKNHKNFLKTKLEFIKNILLTEEKNFSFTLEKGLTILEKYIDKIDNNILCGKIIFLLYDTHGLPLDIIFDICSLKNINLDMKNFKKLMLIQQKNSKKNSIKIIDNNININLKQTTKFVGYKNNIIKSKIIRILKNNIIVNKIYQNEFAYIILNKTPFYPESGGQIGDSGKIKINDTKFKVINTIKKNNIIFHYGKLTKGILKIKDNVISSIDSTLRKKISNNHTAIHLLNYAIRYILNTNIEQKGSAINSKNIHFDFSYNTNISILNIRKIEDIINSKIRKNIPIITEELTLKDALKKNPIRIIKNKYNNNVRLLKIGNFSIELCGGTHAARTGDIGIFKIISESSISSGIRRIEAVTGKLALKNIQKKQSILKNILKLFKTNENNLLLHLNKFYLKFNNIKKNTKNLKKQLAIQIVENIRLKYNKDDNIKLIIHNIKNIDTETMKYIINNFYNKNISLILISFFCKKILIMVKISKNLVQLISAKNIIDIFNEKINTNGGGNIYFAQTEGNYFNNIEQIILEIKKIILKKII